MKKQLALGVCGALITLFLSVVFQDLFRAWELKTLDFRFILRGGTDANADLIMIDADDASAAKYGVWPWKRSLHADLVRFLKEAEASVIAYDVLFALPKDDEQDTALIEASKEAGNLIYPAAVSLAETGESTEGEALKPYLWDPLPGSADKDFFHTENVIFSLPGLLRKNGVGHIATNRDQDGIVRRVPLIVKHQDKLIPALGFQVVLNFLGLTPADVELKGSAVVVHASRKAGMNDIAIPVDDKGQMIINYAGKWGETFKHASFASVGTESAEPSTGKVEDLAGKIIFIANTITGSDVKTIPLEKNYPGPGIHANIINTILTQNFLRETSPWFDVLLILLMGMATAQILHSRRYVEKMVLIFLLAAGYFLVGVILFSGGVIIELFPPIFAILLTSLIVSVYQSTAEKQITDALLKQKHDVESRMAAISRDLAAKEKELFETQGQLDELQEGLVEEKKQEEIRSHDIQELKTKLDSVLKEKNRLQEEHASLVAKFSDLKVNVSEDEHALGDDYEALREECMANGIVTQNKKCLETFRILKQYASVPSPVLILGESGTGKELFARALHLMSPRQNENFIAVNMGAIPRDLVESELFGHTKGAFTGASSSKKGKFSVADRGTIFLDEIGDTQLDAQVKLLRVLQQKEVQPIGGEAFKIDTRVIAATHKNLESQIQKGEFREDLFYRLNALTVTLPPLRERREDIPFLVQHFVEKYASEYGKDLEGVSDQAMKKLVACEWRGNIRELENVIQRGITLATKKLIQEKDLGLDKVSQAPPPVETPARARSGKSKGGVEDETLLNVLREKGFEINETAAQLNMSRNTVSSRFKGICFDLLVKNDLDRNKVAETISDGLPHQDLVHQKIVEYHENLIRTIKNFASEGEAIEAVIKRSKNIPAQYHPAIKELVRKSF